MNKRRLRQTRSYVGLHLMIGQDDNSRPPTTVCLTRQTGVMLNCILADFTGKGRPPHQMDWPLEAPGKVHMPRQGVCAAGAIR